MRWPQGPGQARGPAPTPSFRKEGVGPGLCDLSVSNHLWASHHRFYTLPLSVMGFRSYPVWASHNRRAGRGGWGPSPPWEEGGRPGGSLVVRELLLDTGLRHGFFDRPLPEWVEPVVDWAKARSSGPETRFEGWKRLLTLLCRWFEPFKFTMQRLSSSHEPFEDFEQLLLDGFEPFMSFEQPLCISLEPCKFRGQPMLSCCERFMWALQRIGSRLRRLAPRPSSSVSPLPGRFERLEFCTGHRRATIG